MSRILISYAGFSSSLVTSRDSVDSSIFFPRVGFGGTSPWCCLKNYHHYYFNDKIINHTFSNSAFICCTKVGFSFSKNKLN